MKQVLLYLPVIHSGYEAFLQRHSDSADVMLLGTGFRERFPSLAKDIRALAPARAAGYLRVAVHGPRITVVEPAGLPDAISGDLLVMPDEQVMRDLAEEYRLDSGRSVIFDRTFLRWDRNWSTAGHPVRPDSKIAADQLSRTLLGLADEVSARSSDWWRQVGAVAEAAARSCARRGTVITPPSTPPISTGIRATRSSAGCGLIFPLRSTRRPPSSHRPRGTASAWPEQTCT